MSANQDQQAASPRIEQRTFGFGAGPRARRKIPTGGRSNQDLIDEYLANNKVTKCPTRFADGAVRTSGSYDF
ncbi:hypothetical protein [Bosea sp. RAC05]|uniref:hypothetical protein n=1 Tax=Bosea sp. RAC05 TaxID=1842539 RepID=UPI00083DD0A2|nr:hypothetical protein [Bosea sp. RAC05]AOG03052.1 hypothetical protein BSY19_5000 [Bosea sp. RAC05]